MARPHFFGFLMVIGCILLEISARPSNNEATVTPNFEAEESISPDSENVKEQKSLSYNPIDAQAQNDAIREILEKIKTINEGLKKPYKRQPIRWTSQIQNTAPYILDKDILQQLQQVIASGKLKTNSQSTRQQESNSIYDETTDFHRNSREMQLSRMNSGLQAMQIPYIMSMPVLVMPNMNNIYSSMLNKRLNSLDTESYQTRQGPSESPFQLQWPFANIFPVLIKDPFLSIVNGAGWNNLFEFGQSADVCSRKQRSENYEEEINDIENDLKTLLNSPKTYSSRQKRSVKKRTVEHKSNKQNVEETKKSIFITSTPIRSPTRTPVRKPVKAAPVTPKPQSTKTIADPDEGDLRFPFGNFGFFGDRKPVAPSPGFFINRLKVRRGGVAIAGPGGVATAGRGGTAIVGPGGLAYTQPGGLAVAGPAARIIALSSDADLASVVSRLQTQAAIDGSVSRLLQAIPEGKLVATVQYLPFYGGGKGQYLEVKKDTAGAVTSEKIVSEDSISNENVVKNSNENLISKVLAANLQSLRAISTNLLKLHNLGRKTGYLGNAEKVRYRTQLASLGEAASNTIKLLEEVGDNVDTLFKKNQTLRRYGQPDVEDYVTDEADDGIGVDAPDSFLDDEKDGATIAEAKPVGLAVVGQYGLAASRPIATAVAATGVAVAQPIATAIAGVDPMALNYGNLLSLAPSNLGNKRI